MKNKYILYSLLLLVNIGVVVSSFFYPDLRDELYYLEKDELPNFLEEYYNSYLYINPRIGQLFFNMVARIKWLELIFSLFVFNGFISVLYLNIFRSFPNFKKTNNLQRYLVISAIFIALINYFGEMFYYTAYSGNYTFTHIFYLLFFYWITAYFVFQKEMVFKNLSPLFLVPLGVFIGMSNEHVPPILLLLTAVLGIAYILKQKKSFHYKIWVLGCSVFIGYLLLFFAPANKIKQENAGRSVFDISVMEYADNLGSVLKMYYYYNFTLSLVLILCVGLLLAVYKKLDKNDKMLSWILLFSSVATMFIVTVSPLIGTRLLFFSNALFIIFIIRLFYGLYADKIHQYSLVAYAFLVVFFSFSVVITYHASNVDDELKSNLVGKENQAVILDEQLNFFIDDLGDLNRKILLESGEDYIDENPNLQNSMEKNYMKYYRLQSLRIKKSVLK